MAEYHIQKDLKRLLMRFSISVAEKAFADLLIDGWEPMDAYYAVGLYNPALKADANMHNLELLRNRKGFISYYDFHVSEVRIRQDVEMRQRISGGEVDYRSKDFIISELAKTAETLKGKDRSDVLMKIADLQQMKKDDVRDEEETVHFYLPVNCPRTCRMFSSDR